MFRFLKAVSIFCCIICLSKAKKSIVNNQNLWHRIYNREDSVYCNRYKLTCKPISIQIDCFGIAHAPPTKPFDKINNNRRQMQNQDGTIPFGKRPYFKPKLSSKTMSTTAATTTTPTAIQ